MTDPRLSEAEIVLTRFERLEEAVIDTSSIIVAEKAGFLSVLSAAIDLVSVEDVREEYSAGRDTQAFPPEIRFLPDREGKTTDQKIVYAAIKMCLPLISEDRKILLAADKSRLDYYNALMMLEFLLFKGAVDLSMHGACRGRLVENSRYTPRVKSYAERIHWEIRKRL